MQSIPYDPSLALGNLVDDGSLESIIKISEAAAPSDSAQEQLNALILARRSLDMTIQELTGMSVDSSDVLKSIVDLDKQISSAAADYAVKTIQTQKDIIALKIAAKKAAVPVSARIESPIDYNRTQLKQMPLSADSLKMDAQYFTNEDESEGAKSTVATIRDYVSASTSFLGSTRSGQMTNNAQAQAASQYDNHKIAGTLVITAGCTHKNAVLLAPFVMDPDKAIRAWNILFPQDALSTDHPSQMVTSVMKEDPSKVTSFMKLLSGATYGSSFVGMVHVLRTDSTRSSQDMFAAASSLQASMTTGSWFGGFSGGFGVDSSFANDAKRLLSLQQINSHCSVITMGSIPSIKSSMIKQGVKEFANFTPDQMMGQLAALQNANAGDQESVAEAANAARTGGQLTSLKAAQVKSVMTGLQEGDQAENKMLDINSLMNAFEDYVDKALAGNLGVPITYYLKYVPKSALAHLWVSKYFPQYLAISEDDSGRGGPAPAVPAPQPAPAAQ
jgi:hypothetical protein